MQPKRRTTRTGISFSKPRRAHKEDGASWAVSYVDMLTLLLCFFILFYNMKPVEHDEEQTPLQKVTVGVQKVLQVNVVGSGTGDSKVPTLVSGAGSGTGTGSAQGIIPASSMPTTAVGVAGAGKSDPLIKSIRELLTPITQLDDIEKEGALEINFTGVSFFNSASTKLLPSGREKIKSIIEVLRPNMKDIHVTVQGHTDPRHVASKKMKFADNWELSVLRATSVLKEFVSAEFPQEALSAEGFTAEGASKERGPASEQDLAEMRKITLRIERR